MFDESRFNKIKSKINYNQKQDSIYISNKHFRILSQLVQVNKLKSIHVSYSFSYLYLMTYLFRYTKYNDVVLKSTEIKEMLGYNPETKTINYITKTNGILDEVGLTKTIFDFPLVHEVVDNYLEFTMLSDFNDGKNAYGTNWRVVNDVNFNSNCKYPVLSFYDNIETYKNNGMSLSNEGGAYYDVSDSTLIPFDVFAYCMSHSELGVTGFYIYCYITFKNEINGSCQISIADLSKNCNMSKKTLTTYLNTLREYNLINTVLAEAFVFGHTRNKKYKVDANTHYNNSFEQFIKDNKPISIQKPNYIHASKASKYVQPTDIIDFFGS